VGASGAVSALLGFYVVRFPRFKIRMWFGAFVLVPFVMRQGIARVSSLVFIGFWIALQLVFGIRSLQAGGAEVAYWGHIGGFALGLAGALATRQARLGRQEFWMKEADYRFYKQKWYAAMELYQRLAEQFPACAEARVKWALCWECAGLPARAESVLRDALRFYEDNGLPDQAAAIREQLGSLTKQRDAPRRAAATTAYPNLMFRRKLKSEENRHD
jgi:tetratricopeptide (TPR) repeat protein